MIGETLRRAAGVLAVVLAAHGVGQAMGCAAASNVAKAIDEVNDPADDVALKRCRDLARSIKAATGDASAAYDGYYACTVDAGLR